MTFSEFASHMYPYWLQGLFMIWIAYASGNKDLLKVDKGIIVRWIKIFIVISIYRYLVLKFAPHLSPASQEAIKNVTSLPWQGTLTVFWEDACHGLPLVLLRRLIGDSIYAAPVHFLAMGFVMLSFASGHLYQGFWPAIFLSAYIPFSVMVGERRGFGTMMVTHTLYDLTTILTLKMLVG
jgi:hypothetical protein